MMKIPSPLIAIIAFISGLILFNFIVFMLGYLAAIPIPREYFLWFGREHIVTALAVYDLFLNAIPKFIATFVWTLCTILIFRNRYALTTAFCFLGYWCSYVYVCWNDDFVVNHLAQVFLQPPYLPGLLADLCGIILAGIGFYKFQRGKQTSLHLA